ncbi:MAG: Cysteine desulfurase, partial [Planctomycetota bacterium]
WESLDGNPSSQHQGGQQARCWLEEARDAILKSLGADSKDRMLFTSGGTESNHLALLGFVGDRPSHILVSAIEHPSLLGAATLLRAHGHQVDFIPVNNRGLVEPESVRRLLTPATRLVSVMLANNETGVLQPVRELAQICRQHGVLVHTDAVQAVGKIPVEFRDLGVDGLTCTPHKFHGPVGIGGLVLRQGVELHPLMRGGFQQFGLRPGTEPVALAVGFRVALEASQEKSRVGFATSSAEEEHASLQTLRDRFERALSSQIPVVIHGQGAARVPQTSCLSFPDCDRQRLLLALDMDGISASTGSACASGSSEPSPVLVAMGIPPDQVQAALRFSFGRQNTSSQVDEAVRRILLAYKRLLAAESSRNPLVAPRQSAAKIV